VCGGLDRDISSDGERCVPVDVLAAASDGNRQVTEPRICLQREGANCSHSAEWQQFESTRHIGNLSGENVNPIEQPRQRELLQGRSACDVVFQRRRGDGDYSEGDDYSDVESDGLLDTTVVTAKYLTGKRNGDNRCYHDDERNGGNPRYLDDDRDGGNRHYLNYKFDDSNRCYFDVVGSTRHQAVSSSDRDAYNDDDDEIQYYAGFRETPTPRSGSCPRAGHEPDRGGMNITKPHSNNKTV